MKYFQNQILHHSRAFITSPHFGVLTFKKGGLATWAFFQKLLLIVKDNSFILFPPKLLIGIYNISLGKKAIYFEDIVL